MAESLLELSMIELAQRVRRKEISPVEVVQKTLERIEKLDSRLNSYITVLAEQAVAEARIAEREIQRGNYRGPLHGLPIAVKDIFATRGVRTTAGSKILSDWVPDYDATVVTRLRNAGAVLIGKTNMHEFSYGVTSDNPHYGPVRNPWDPKRIPGGSSGGSGAAVATSLCAAALGSDTGGSIRIPAAACGVVGLKPTYGRVSRYGVVPFAWSLDHVGPITRTVEDAAALLKVLAGQDTKDRTSSQLPVPEYTQVLKESVSGVRLGIPQNFFFEHVDSEILSAVRAAIKVLERLGARSVAVKLEHFEYCSAAAAQITLVEAASYHEPYVRGRSQDYGDDVRLRLYAARNFLATDYVKSQRARTLLQQDLAQAFEQVDAIVTPTLPAPPPPIGEYFVQSGDMREHVIDAFIRFNNPFNLTGLPAISVPCGFGSANLPIGLQIVGKPFDEATVLRLAHAYQAHTEWHKKHPSL
jgi:aspartyl-tRNA(Asn)/glutamyl-tRNA(Gln) amidotransferase subunit A